jgi:hypothetical protein
METITHTSSTMHVSRVRIWTARILGGIVTLFMLMDSVFKFIPNEQVVSGTTELGFKVHHLPILGTLGFVSTLLFTLPRTQFVGAILLTGYFGGAIATHVRLDNPLFSHILFPVYLALFAWVSVWLRNEHLRRLIPVLK